MIAYAFLLFLYVVAACSRNSERDAQNHTPAAPKLYKITSIGGPPFQITVEWEPVEFYDRTPNSGYKVKMWESKKTLVMFKIGNVWNKKYVAEQWLHTMSKTAPVEQILGVYETKALFDGIKLDVDYQVRVQAFDHLRHGPYSNALGIKLLNPRKSKMNHRKIHQQ